jgi:hypothetical protein
MTHTTGAYLGMPEYDRYTGPEHGTDAGMSITKIETTWEQENIIHGLLYIHRVMLWVHWPGFS